MRCFEIGNAVEGLVWLIIAMVLLAAGPRCGPYGPMRMGAAFTFALFGLSDWIEIRTGHWADPWPLLVLKSGCVLSLIAHYVWYRIIRNRLRSTKHGI